MNAVDLKYQVFFFATPMPLDLQSIPFNPIDISAVMQNSHTFISGMDEFQSTHVSGESVVSVSKTSSVDELPISGEGLTQENYNKVLFNDFATQEVLTSDVPTFGITGWNDLPEYYGFHNSISDAEFKRIGFHDSCIVLDLTGTKQIFPARLYYYVPSTADQALLDTVFEDYLSTLDAGTYQSTYTFNQETMEVNEVGDTVYILEYAVDLVAGGTENVSITVLKDDSIYNDGYFVDSASVEDKGTFKKHNIAESEIPIVIDAVGVRQRLITSKQKAPSWSGSAWYDTSCKELRVDVWSEANSEWVESDTVNIEGEGFLTVSINPTLVESYIRLVCVSGLLEYEVVVDGDPHWSVNNVSVYSKASPIASSVETIQWALIVPVEEIETKANTLLDPSRSTYLPYIVCDVNATGLDAGIEVESTNIDYGRPPAITKFDLVFKD